MATEDQLKDTVSNIFRSRWDTRKGQVVPDPSALKLANDAIEFDRATILYADLAESTSMVDSKSWQFAARVYKTYLHCAASLIRDHGGEITSYDGDRVMGVWIDNRQCSNATKCALKINYAVTYIINPAVRARYPDTPFTVKQVVGIDTSEIRAARTGVRGGNDIVWVGRAANYAAKLTSLSENATWITKAVYDQIADSSKFKAGTTTNMWSGYTWNAQGSQQIYGSNYWWKI